VSWDKFVDEKSRLVVLVTMYSVLGTSVVASLPIVSSATIRRFSMSIICISGLGIFQHLGEPTVNRLGLLETRLN